MNMIELDAKQVPDTIVKDAFVLAQEYIDMMCDIQMQFASQFEVIPKEITYNKPSQAVLDFVRELFVDDIKNNMIGNTKVSFNERFYDFQHQVSEEAKDHIDDELKEDFTNAKIKMAVFQIVKEAIRDRTLGQ